MLSRLIPAFLVIVVASFYASSHGAAHKSRSASDLDSSTTPAPPECMAYCNTTECFDHVNATADEWDFECRHCNAWNCSHGCSVNLTSNSIHCQDYRIIWPPDCTNCTPNATTPSGNSTDNGDSSTIIIVASVVSALVFILIVGVTIGVIVVVVRWYRKRRANVEPPVSKEQEEIAVMFPKTPAEEAIVEPAAPEPPKLTLQQLLPDNKKSTVSIDQALANAGAQETEAVFLGEHRGDRDLNKKKRQKPEDDLETKEVFTDQAKIDEKHHEPQKETTKETKVIRGKTAAADEPTKDRTMNDVPSNSRNTINAPMETSKNKKAANKETKEESTYDPTKEEKAGKALPPKKASAGKVANAKKGLMNTTDVQDELDAAEKLTGS